MPFLPRISSPLSEPWTAWVMALLLILLLLADRMQRGTVLNSLRALFDVKERDSIFSATVKNIYGEAALMLYKTGIFALALYVSVFHTGSFGFLSYLLIWLLVAATVFLQYLLSAYTFWLFLDFKAFAVARLHSANLANVFSFLLYPFLLVVLFTPFISRQALLVGLAVLLAAALAVWLMKAFRLFFTNFLAGFYIFLYLCTLEIVPLCGMVLAAQAIVN